MSHAQAIFSRTMVLTTPNRRFLTTPTQNEVGFVYGIVGSNATEGNCRGGQYFALSSACVTIAAVCHQHRPPGSNILLAERIWCRQAYETAGEPPAKIGGESGVGGQCIAATSPYASDERTLMVQSHFAREKHLRANLVRYSFFTYVLTGEPHRKLTEHDAFKPACRRSVPCEPNSI